MKLNMSWENVVFVIDKHHKEYQNVNYNKVK